MPYARARPPPQPTPQPTEPSCSIRCAKDLSATWIPSDQSCASKGFWMCCKACNTKKGCKKGQSKVAYGPKPKTKSLCCQCPNGQVPNGKSGCIPIQSPTPSPTDVPTPSPTDLPTPSPTDEPTPSPTDVPTPSPSEGDCPAGYLATNFYSFDPPPSPYNACCLKDSAPCSEPGFRVNYSGIQYCCTCKSGKTFSTAPLGCFDVSTPSPTDVPTPSPTDAPTPSPSERDCPAGFLATDFNSFDPLPSPYNACCLKNIDCSEPGFGVYDAGTLYCCSCKSGKIYNIATLPAGCVDGP